MATSTRLPSFWTAFGPGLLWAAAAIGVSHLVQSTRAGADAGFALAGVILIALVLKYPFFEYGPRYAAATGESLVEGYARVGAWALWLYFLITIATALIIQVVIVVFTSFLLQTALGLTMPLAVVGGLLILTCAALLRLGRFRALDRTVKFVLALLALSTLFAAVLAVPRTDLSSLAVWPPASAAVPFAFILALAGWMPSAIDISVWSSAWTLAKNRDTGTEASVRHALLDFRIGYVATGVLAFAFLLLGATVMYQSGTSFSPQGTQFSLQLADLYSQTLGAWTRPIVMVAMVTTMFSTALTVIDGFPRALARSVRVIRSGVADGARADTDRVYWVSGAVLGGLTVLVMHLLVGSLTTMVDFATIVSFLTAPILGYLNLRVVTGANVAPEHRPGPALVWLSYAGLILLGGTALVYLASRF
ncbi:MAG TPA: divalent metal cation transporter [Vicinamibacterales bacterium]|nr:divalent metal cation transporter [Vicinamibacterales bacterium]